MTKRGIDMEIKKECPTCNGKREFLRMTIYGTGFWVACWRCNGTGYIRESKVSVNSKKELMSK